jgi:hypothetical protein
LPVLDGLLLPAAFGPSRNRILAVMANKVGSGLGHVHEDSRKQMVRVVNGKGTLQILLTITDDIVEAVKVDPSTVTG